MLENRTEQGASTPIADRQTVTPDGEPVDQLPEGMSVRDIVTHTDDRGTVFELFDPRWGWHAEPLVYSYVFTIRPGVVKAGGFTNVTRTATPCCSARWSSSASISARTLPPTVSSARSCSPSTGASS